MHAFGKEALTLRLSGEIRAAVQAIARMEKASIGVVNGLEKMAASGSKVLLR